MFQPQLNNSNLNLTHASSTWHVSSLTWHVPSFTWHVPSLTWHVPTLTWMLRSWLNNSLPRFYMFPAWLYMFPVWLDIIHSWLDIRGAKSAATWQPSCQKVFEESGSDRKFLDLLPHFFVIEQFGGRVKEMILILLHNRHFFVSIFSLIPKNQ